jgi:hypothetical protein
MLVRWLGAFSGSQHTGSASNLSTSLAFELARPATDLVACEAIKRDSKISHAKIGLLISNKHVIREFKHDCWSVKTSNGGLRATRHDAPSQHAEAWAKAEYSAVVIKAGATARAVDEAIDFAKANNLKILFLQQDDYLKSRLVNFDRRVYLKKYSAKM